jgi:hypothetical protein
VRCLAGQQELCLRSSVLEENQNEEPESRDLLRHHMHAGIIQPRRTYMSQAQGGVLESQMFHTERSKNVQQNAGVNETCEQLCPVRELPLASYWHRATILSQGDLQGL